MIRKRWLLAGLMVLASTTSHAQQESTSHPLNILQSGQRPNVADEGNPLLFPAKPITGIETDYNPSTAERLPRAVSPKPLAITSRNITQEVNGFVINGIVATPELTSPTLALLLIPGLDGLNKEVHDLARAYASRGTVTLAISLIGSEEPKSRREAIQRMSRLDRNRTLSMLKAARQWLSDQSQGKLGVGVAGYALGAEWALLMAGESPPPKGVILYCGGVTNDSQILSRIHCPLLGFFSRQDQYLTPDRVSAFEDALKKSGINAQIFNYEIEPGFAIHPKNDNAKRYAETAIERSIDFVLQH